MFFRGEKVDLNIKKRTSKDIVSDARIRRTERQTKRVEQKKIVFLQRTIKIAIQFIAFKYEFFCKWNKLLDSLHENFDMFKLLNVLSLCSFMSNFSKVNVTDLIAISIWINNLQYVKFVSTCTFCSYNMHLSKLFEMFSDELENLDEPQYETLVKNMHSFFRSFFLETYCLNAETHNSQPQFNRLTDLVFKNYQNFVLRDNTNFKSFLIGLNSKSVIERLANASIVKTHDELYELLLNTCYCISEVYEVPSSTIDNDYYSKNKKLHGKLMAIFCSPLQTNNTPDYAALIMPKLFFRCINAGFHKTMFQFIPLIFEFFSNIKVKHLQSLKDFDEERQTNALSRNTGESNEQFYRNQHSSLDNSDSIYTQSQDSHETEFFLEKLENVFFSSTMSLHFLNLDLTEFETKEILAGPHIPMTDFMSFTTFVENSFELLNLYASNELYKHPILDLVKEYYYCSMWQLAYLKALENKYSTNSTIEEHQLCKLESNVQHYYHTLQCSLSSIHFKIKKVFSSPQIYKNLSIYKLTYEQLDNFTDIINFLVKLNVSIGAFKSILISVVNLWPKLLEDLLYHDETKHRQDLVQIRLTTFLECYSTILKNTSKKKYLLQTLPIPSKEMVTHIVDFIFSKNTLDNMQSVVLMKNINNFLRVLHRLDPLDGYMPDGFPRFKRCMLEYCPQLVSLNTKISYLIKWLSDDTENYRGKSISISISRNDLLESAFKQINNHLMAYPIKVKFVNELGLQEIGVDGGGLQRELITLLVQLVFEENYGIFQNCDNFIVPITNATKGQLDKFEFAGRLLGKCLRMGMLVDVPISKYFLRSLLGYETQIDHLEHESPELYQGLQSLLEMDAAEVEKVGLTFTANVDGKTVELMPNGEDVVVNHENREEFVQLFVYYKFNKSIQNVARAFHNGFFDIVNREWTKMFTEDELSIVLAGSKNEIDVDDLMQNVEYYGGYHEHHPTIVLFWKIFRCFSNYEKSLLIKFITSAPRQPILGFSSLRPKIAIRRNGFDEEYLPTSSTCLNLLKLPEYKSELVMKKKILEAIQSGSGFELS